MNERTRWHTAQLKRMKGEDSASEHSQSQLRTFQEASDGSRAETIRIASVEASNLFGLSEIGGMFEQRERLQPTGIVSLNKTNDWNVGSRSHFAAAR